MPKHERCLLCRIARTVGLVLAGLLTLSLLAAGGLALWLARADLKPVVEQAASGALARQVTLRTLDVRWGDPLSIDLTGLRIANADWGSAKDMVQIGRLSALVDPFSLLSGALHYQRLRIEDATVALERDANGTGNWDTGVGAPAIALVPKDRTQFPTLIDFAGRNGRITYRTRGGSVLTIALDQVAISSASSRAGAIVHAEGAYNDVALRLDAITASFATLQAASEPFGAHFTLAGQDTDLTFDGTLAEPLDFEGAHGALSIEAQTSNDILGILGSTTKAAVPLSIAGALNREGEHWSLSAAKGRLADSNFTGDLKLREGGAGKPDDLAFDLRSSALDLDAMTAALDTGGSTTGLVDIKLDPNNLPDLNVSAALRTPRLAIGGRTLRDVALQGRLANGAVTLKGLRFALGGGTLEATGSLAREQKSPQLSVNAHLAQADAATIAQSLGAAGDEIRGNVQGAAVVTLRGATIGDALRDSKGGAVLVLTEGDVARSLIERASTDLRRLFRNRQGRVKARCMLAVMTLDDGVGTLSPLRLESDEAVLGGAGRLDLIGRRLDLTLQSERASTSFFALDVPIRVSGPLAGLRAAPLPSGDNASQNSMRAVESLPPEVRSMANASACLK